MTGREEETENGIVFVADHWGEYHGGIDVFNESLCKAMAYVVEHSSVAVICLVFGAVGNQYVNESREKGIYIVRYIETAGERDETRKCNAVIDDIRREIPCKKYIWIGHDLHTGWTAYHLSQIRREKCAVIFHTEYFSVHVDRLNAQRREEIALDYTQKRDQQEELARCVDWVFCVGPVVYQRFKNMRNAYEIIPGMDPNLLEDRIGEHNLIMTAGRFDADTDYQKKWNDTCDGIGKALDFMHDHRNNGAEYQIMVYGFSEKYTSEELDEIRKNITNNICNNSKDGIRVSVNLHYFDKTRTDFLKNLSRSSVFVMGSWKESFGLVAWEALSMGIPIVVSESSGIYLYMERELGYLLKGLCGSFEAGTQDSTKEMGSAIAGILVNADKIKDSTDVLRKEMSKRNKWETLAIKMAKKIGIKDVMSEEIFHNQKSFEFTYTERRLLLDEIKKRVQSRRINKRIVFFDGISSKNILCDEKFFAELVRMLCSDEKSQVEIYFGYPTKNAIIERISQIDGDNVDIKSLEEKVHRIANLKKFIDQMWSDNKIAVEEERYKACLDRIHLVPLDKSPSVYINILDDDWYFTVKYEKRSSENATMKLQLANSEEGGKEKQNLIDHMKFILKASQDEEESKKMLQQIETW